MKSLREKLHEAPIFCLTADVDWASEEALRIGHEVFVNAKAKATYFMTHSSPFLYSMIEEGKIDAGIHPNFLSDSSQGSSYEEVTEYCLNLLPDVRCFRSHRYYDVTDITHEFYAKGLRYDSNTCTLLQQGILPFLHESGLLRFPTFFEDGTYLWQNRGLDFGQSERELFSKPGLKIISVHPMHMVMNSPDINYSRRVKDNLSRAQWIQLSERDLLELQYKGRGIRDFVVDLLAFIHREEYDVLTLNDLYLKWSRENYD